ncbi:nitroreductase family protein [Parasulfuritortus cantonensis]|uniref:nitroreductase family protein n=1 Tax=Parasulfuritortus cantonensis TaxID=2528202 RepID=UPI001F0FB385|nr:nitroreductase family protein [Parasulfuritortus cantonensis]
MIDKQTVLDICHFRHACKEFDPARKIPAEDFDLILETGRLSPSSFGYEPWQFLVIQDPALRDKLLPVTWGPGSSCPPPATTSPSWSARAACATTANTSAT